MSSVTIHGNTYDNVHGINYVNKSGNSFALRKLILNGNVAWTKPVTYDLVLENNTWEQISEAAKSGVASEIWSVGDQKIITVDGNDYAVDIIGFDHDDVTDATTYGRSRAGITFQMHGLYATQYTMNDSSDSTGGWKDSVMRTSTMAALFGLLDSDLSNVIVPVNKVTGGGLAGQSEDIVSDSLFLLSDVEIFGNEAYESNVAEGSQYSYYASGNPAIKYIPGNVINAWWTRSPRLYNQTSFIRVGTTGAHNVNGASNKNGVAFAFCV